jgi:flagellar biosynthesis/type III secretory pathway chaperone
MENVKNKRTHEDGIYNNINTTNMLKNVDEESFYQRSGMASTMTNMWGGNKVIKVQ